MDVSRSPGYDPVLLLLKCIPDSRTETFSNMIRVNSFNKV